MKQFQLLSFLFFIMWSYFGSSVSICIKIYFRSSNWGKTLFPATLWALKKGPSEWHHCISIAGNEIRERTENIAVKNCVPIFFECSLWHVFTSLPTGLFVKPIDNLCVTHRPLSQSETWSSGVNATRYWLLLLKRLTKINWRFKLDTPKKDEITLNCCFLTAAFWVKLKFGLDCSGLEIFETPRSWFLWLNLEHQSSQSKS